jgi:hypothetical protein
MASSGYSNTNQIKLEGIYTYEPNQGQWDESVLWRGRLKDGFVFVTDDGLHFDLFSLRDSSGITIREGARFKMTFGGKQNKKKAFSAKIKQKNNLYRNGKPLNKNKPLWSRDNNKIIRENKLVLSELYDNIDLKLYTEMGQFRFDFIAMPGSDISDIEIGFEGNDGLLVKDSVVDVIFGGKEIKIRDLNTFKGKKDKSNKISSKFKKSKNKITFDLSGFSQNDTLIIDPIIESSDPNHFWLEMINIKSRHLYNGYRVTAMEISTDSLQIDNGSYTIVDTGSGYKQDYNILVMKHLNDSLIDYNIFGSTTPDYLYDILTNHVTKSIFISGSTEINHNSNDPDHILRFPNADTTASYKRDTPGYQTVSHGFIIEIDMDSLTLKENNATFLYPGNKNNIDSLIFNPLFDPYFKYRTHITDIEFYGHDIYFSGIFECFTPSALKTGQSIANLDSSISKPYYMFFSKLNMNDRKPEDPIVTIYNDYDLLMFEHRTNAYAQEVNSFYRPTYMGSSLYTLSRTLPEKDNSEIITSYLFGDPSTSGRKFGFEMCEINKFTGELIQSRHIGTVPLNQFNEYDPGYTATNLFHFNDGNIIATQSFMDTLRYSYDHDSLKTALGLSECVFSDHTDPNFKPSTLVFSLYDNEMNHKKSIPLLINRLDPSIDITSGRYEELEILSYFNSGYYLDIALRGVDKKEIHPYYEYTNNVHIVRFNSCLEIIDVKTLGVDNIDPLIVKDIDHVFDMENMDGPLRVTYSTVDSKVFVETIEMNRNPRHGNAE